MPNIRPLLPRVEKWPRSTIERSPTDDVAHNTDVTITDERRLVTVLFADLVGFTGRAEQADPETVRELQRAYFAAVTREVVRFGGTLEKYIGDAAMAIFGAPQAHDDDAERALRSALEIRTALGELEGGLRGPHRRQHRRGRRRHEPVRRRATTPSAATPSTWRPGSSRRQHPARSSSVA